MYVCAKRYLEAIIITFQRNSICSLTLTLFNLLRIALHSKKSIIYSTAPITIKHIFAFIASYIKVLILTYKILISKHQFLAQKLAWSMNQIEITHSISVKCRIRSIDRVHNVQLYLLECFIWLYSFYILGYSVHNTRNTSITIKNN
jgi:hypothetical protein